MRSVACQEELNKGGPLGVNRYSWLYWGEAPSESGAFFILLFCERTKGEGREFSPYTYHLFHTIS